MTFLQASQALQASEPILVGALVVGGGAGIMYGVRTLMTMRDALMKLVIAFYGDPDNPKPNGLVRSVEKIEQRQEKHMADTTSFQQGVSMTLGEITTNVDAHTRWQKEHNGDPNSHSAWRQEVRATVDQRHRDVMAQLAVLAERQKGER